MSIPTWIDNDYIKGLVSVIIPSYNRAGFLREALQSVCEQTYRPIECIVVDDGSIDDTDVMVKDFAQRANESFKIYYVHQQNAGAQVARNRGTLASRGEFIQYLDSDDLLYKEKISNQVKFLREHPSVDGVFGDWNSGTPEKYNTIKAYKSNDLINQMLTETCISNFAFLIRRKSIINAGPWDVNIKRYQEVDYHLTALLTGANFEYYPNDCGLWRYHLKERIQNRTGLLEIIAFYQKWERKLKEKNIFSELLRKNICNWYFYLFTQYQHEKKDSKISLLKEMIRLNPHIAFYNNPKMRFLVAIVGQENALNLWMKRFASVSRSRNRKKIGV